MTTSLSARLQSLRVAAGWSQSEFSRRAGLSQGHISELESGRASPSQRCLEKMALAHGITVDVLLEGTDFSPRKRGPRRLKKHTELLRRQLGRCHPRFITCTLQQAFSLARLTHLGPELIRTVDAQRRPPGFWVALKHLAQCLNSGEQTLLLHLMADGHDLEDLTPPDIGLERPVLWDPRRRWLAVVIKRRGVTAVVFPQLGVVTHPGRHRTLDFFVTVSRGDEREDVDVEVDGPHHRGRETEDALRDDEVGFTVLRIPLRSLDRRDFADYFIRRLVGLLDQSTRRAA